MYELTLDDSFAVVQGNGAIGPGQYAWLVSDTIPCQYGVL